MDMHNLKFCGGGGGGAILGGPIAPPYLQPWIPAMTCDHSTTIQKVFQKTVSIKKYWMNLHKGVDWGAGSRGLDPKCAELIFSMLLLVITTDVKSLS